MKTLIAILILLGMSNCMKSKHADLVIHHGHIASFLKNKKDDEAIAISKGKIIEIGPERQILNKYNYSSEIDAQSGYIYPLLSDADFPYFEFLYQKLITNINDHDSDSKKVTIIEKSIQSNNKTSFFSIDWNKIKDKSLFTSKIKQLSKAKKIYFFSKNNLNQCQLFANNTISLINENLQQVISKTSHFVIIEKAEELDKEFTEKGIASLHLHGISLQELNLLSKVSIRGYLTFFCYIDVNSVSYKELKTLKEKFAGKVKFAGIFVDTNCKSTFQEIKKNAVLNRLQLSFSHAYYKKNKAIIIKNLSSMNSDHRWRVVKIDSLSAKDYFELINNNLYPTFHFNTKLPKDFPKNIEMIGIGYGKFNISKNIKNSILKENSMKAYCYWNTVHSFSENQFTLIERNKKANFSIYPVQIENVTEIPFVEYQFLDGKRCTYDNLLN